jgi:arylsulfatase A-like enzyme
MVNNMRPGDETVDRALAWLESSGTEPFFLWVHLFDPHAPYEEHGIERAPNPTGTIPAAARKNLRAYDQEIAFADAQLGRVLDRLEARGALETSLIILTADHGEAFGEQGESGHGRHLFESTQHVPLILAHSSLGRGRVSDLPVSTLDVSPTVLAALDLPPLPNSDGIDLGAALAAPGSFASRPIYMETYHGARKKFWRIFAPPLTGEPIRVAVRQGNWKAVLSPRSGKLQLFELAAGRGEGQDLAADQSVRARRFRPLLVAHAQREYKPESGASVLTEEDRRRLESLGYVD